MEEGKGKALEMTPLTQANSVDDGGNDDEEILAELLEGSLEESTTTKAITIGVGDGDGDGVEHVRGGTTSDATNSFGTSGAALLETGGKDAAGHDKNGTQFWKPSLAPSGSSPPCRERRGTLGFDGEARRGVSKASDGRREVETSTNPDERVLESFDGEDQTTTSAVWRECLVPVKLLQEKRVRAILFVYGVYSVRGEECAYTYIPANLSAKQPADGLATGIRYFV